MSELDSRSVQFHTIENIGATRSGERLEKVGQQLATLAVTLAENNRRMVWPPVEVELAGFIAASVPAEATPPNNQ